jgi:hypothetical protein
MTSFWGFNDQNYINFAFNVYFYNDSSACSPALSPNYPDRDICYVKGINEPAVLTAPAYFQACLNVTGTGPSNFGNLICGNTGGQGPFPTDYQIWFGLVSTNSYEMYLFYCNTAPGGTNAVDFAAFVARYCNQAVTASNIPQMLANPRWTPFYYQFNTNDFGVLNFGAGVYGSWMEARVSLSLLQIQTPRGRSSSSAETPLLRLLLSEFCI